MSQATTPFPHPLVAVVDDVAECLDHAEGCNPLFLSTDHKEQVLVGLSRQMARLEALRLKVLAAADDVAEDHGARNAGAWLAHATRQDGPAGRRMQRLADGLDCRWPVLAEAYAAGRASTEQVQVIGRALDELPTDLDPDLRARAETHLVEQCAHFTPRDLKVLGRRVLEVVAPEIAEAHEAKLCAHVNGG